MALFSQATDLATKQTIWVARNVVKGREQLNSHRDDDFGRCYAREGIDGFSTVEIAGMHTPFIGNDWESKYVEFMAMWNGVE